MRWAMRGAPGGQGGARPPDGLGLICHEGLHLSFDPRNHTASPTELAGRVIAITGASSGLGRAVALACARHGANVILIGRNTHKLEAVHADIETSGGPEPIIALLDLEKALARDYDGNPARITEADALIAYLQTLGTLVDFKLYDDKANIR